MPVSMVSKWTSFMPMDRFAVRLKMRLKKITQQKYKFLRLVQNGDISFAAIYGLTEVVKMLVAM